MPPEYHFTPQAILRHKDPISRHLSECDNSLSIPATGRRVSYCVTRVSIPARPGNCQNATTACRFTPRPLGCEIPPRVSCFASTRKLSECDRDLSIHATPDIGLWCEIPPQGAKSRHYIDLSIPVTSLPFPATPGPVDSRHQPVILRQKP